MNTLSWLLYFADVLYTQTTYLVVGSEVTILIYLLVRTISAACSETIYSWDSESIIKKKKKRQGEFFIHNWKFITIPLVLIFVLNFIPSKETFYLIVASEAGEYVVNTPEAKELLKDVQEIVQIQLENLKVKE